MGLRKSQANLSLTEKTAFVDALLALKQRSLCTVAMLAALGHTHELKGHLRGAINNGATLVELREVLLHVAPYAGVPASVAAFRAASEWLAAEGLSFDNAPAE